ncbi:hypothetical protein GCM10028808_74900 [Spirosoma migulaei]
METIKPTPSPVDWPIPHPPNSSEIWKPFPGFEDRYELSSFGRICSVHTGILIRTSVDADGYECLRVKQGGRKKTIVVRVDWVVATAFLPNSQEHSFLVHLDGNKLNSQAGNLQWTPAQLSTPSPISHE